MGLPHLVDPVKQFFPQRLPIPFAFLRVLPFRFERHLINPGNLRQHGVAHIFKGDMLVRIWEAELHQLILHQLCTLERWPYKCQKALFFNGFCQFEKIWENHEKCQLHSQLHSNCIQKMAVPTLPRTTTCSSSMAGLFFFAHDGSFIALSNKTIKESKNSE